jgi:DNA polymerase-3 subunit delta
VGLREYLARVPETAILVFVDVVALDKGNPFLAAVKNVRGSLREFKALSGSALAAWIESRVAAVGGRILPSAVQTLAAFVGSDLRRLGLEIDKLMSYAGGRVIDDGMVELLVADAREARIFDLTDAVALHRVDRALGLLHQLTDEGSAPPVVMVMLTRQVRILLQVKELMEQGSTPTAIASHLRLHPYVVDKAIQQARSVSIQRLEDMYRRLLEADAAMKGGKLDAGAALDLLLLDLTRR